MSFIQRHRRMAGYPIKCNVCSENVTSREDHLRHFLLHQSQIASLVQDLFRREPGEACESPNDAADSEPCSVYPVPGDREEGCHQPPPKRQKRATKRTKNLKCPEGGCKWAFNRERDLIRHRFSHYLWNQACDECSDKFTTASAFIQHECGGQSPEPEQVDYRRTLVESSLGVHITSANPIRRGKRIKAEHITTSAPAVSLELCQELGTEVPQRASSNNAPLQTMQGMPSSAPVDSAQHAIPANGNVNLYPNLSLWEEFGVEDWCFSGLS